jgi:hypothetical protein
MADPLARLAEDISAARALPAIDRAAALRRLVDRARIDLGAAGDAAVAEATRGRALSYTQAAAHLGVSEQAINKAVSRHNQRARP